MDWGSIIIAGIGSLIAAGGVGGFMYYKANRGGATADAIDKAADAMKKLLDNFSQQQEMFNKSLEDRDKSIKDRDDLIQQYKIQIRELKKEVDDLRFRMGEYEETIKTMKKRIDTEITVIDSLRCVNQDCKLRVKK